ncbi:hypothetical protein PI125_g8216 [Phytophthora idaei]|nr:hypothetical protein PI125_g8216 [Phytophthora idaei]
MNSSPASKYHVPIKVPDPPMPKAGRFPRTLTAEDDGDGFLYKGSTSTVVKRAHGFQRKPPHIDMAREYEAAGKSYKAARTTVTTLNERHRQLQIAQEESFERERHDRNFTSNFAETRLATCGVPTLNSMSVRIERQRELAKAKAKDSSPSKPTNKKLREGAHREHLNMQIRAAVRRSYGSQELDLKSLELVHIPRTAVFSTLLLQLARTIRTVNVSRNALRELPDTFVQAFPEVETLVCKENALARLPLRVLGELRYLRVLNVSGNQLDELPDLPDTLETLDASRNRLQDIQTLHVLTRLVTLDLSYNHFQLLPCGLMALHKLQTLTLAGNRLVTLATRPQLTRRRAPGDDDTAANPQDDEGADEPTEDENETARKQWRVEVDPISNDTVYFHLQSKRVTRAKPKCFQVRIPKLQLPGNQVEKQDKPALLERYPDGWEIILPSPSDTSTALRFVNHCTGENYSTLPPALDRWDGVDHLQLLVLSGNELLEFPPSIGKLKRLKRLEAENNKLLTFPDVLQGLEALETVKLGMNGLTALPPSFSKLVNLIDVDIKLNRLRELPERLGDVQQLRVLDASANALEKLPRSFLALRRLVTLRLSGNTPLLAAGFAAETLRTGNLAEIRWQLEHQIECAKHGGSRPPEPRARLIGVGSECWSTDLHINREFARAVELARETQTLSMHWRGIEAPELPRVFFTAVPDLRELRLSGQNLDILPAGFGTFTKLRLLQLRQNGIRVIKPEVFGSVEAQNLGIGTSLESLDVRYNRLETLPDTFTNCVKLHVLRASHNIIVSLPEVMDGLVTLTDLQLAHNQLVTGLRALSSLRALERLDLSFNRIETLDELDFSQLPRLQVLRLSGNRLTELPMSLGGMGTSDGVKPPIRELTFAGNMLVEFPPAVLLLGATLQRLEMQSNRFERLPLSFGAALPGLEIVESDGNPFRSPPAEVMRLGAKAIRSYLLKREQRVDELTALLNALGLIFDRETFDKPIMRHLLPPDVPLTSLPFLKTKHLTAFDRAVDRYVNEEEVTRRELDEKRLQEAQDALLPQIRAFLETPEGEKRFQREVGTAKDTLRIHLRALTKQLKRHRVKLKPLAKAHAREEKLEKKMQRAAEKAAKSGKEISVKKSETLGELKARIAKREKLEFAEARVREDVEELERGKARLGQGHAAFRHEVEQILLEKVAATVRQHLVRQQRDKAIAMGWRRPWDGVGGRAFERYQRQILRHKLGGVDEEGAAAAPDSVSKSVIKPDAKDKAEGDENEDSGDDVASDDNSEISDVSFDGYDELVTNMAREGDEDDDDDDEESAAIAEAARAAAMAALEAEEAERAADDLDDISSDDDDKPRESEDSDL